MSFQIHCPHCNRVLNVTDKAYGKVLPCPGCQQPMTVPRPEDLQSPPAESRPAVAAATAAPAPPLPQTDGSLQFLGDAETPAGAPRFTMPAVPGVDLAGMFLGNEKEQVFGMLPGETTLDTLTVQNHYFFVVRSGITRITLTTHRLLFSETRVFSPIYWILLVLFPPLLLYYLGRIARNRSVAMPLRSVDSVEKRYYPNWLWFVVAILLMTLIAGFFSSTVSWLSGQPHHRGIGDDFSVMPGFASALAIGLLSPVVLILLLTTRVIGLRVVSGNNSYFVRFNPADFRENEAGCDRFLQNVFAQVECTRSGQATSSNG